MATEFATFAAGCFWGVEETFRKIPGVVDVEVGYTGGQTPRPTYRDVCSSKTGHAEAVRIEYDPAQVTYNDLLHVFWNNHDPTQLDRQGPDVGPQYRSVIFTHSPEQEQVARSSRDALQASGRHSRPVVTHIEPAKEWYRAEEHHQRYFEKRGVTH